eukprot:CAMPEP_0116068726 /NCGR_PEP_ID=MMETSP0322-20121206/11842_1 /TAXON_ID=163516 /ORGANISM="Leptocylindrus danicus var. apora, Strain B651" /LENGTH=116 /DNA_ID=CAMNT_0003555911 /DNA_START=117 /DNA_END=464 /DNA_ORIENTATION=+
MVLNTNDVFEAMNEAVQKSTSVSKKFKGKVIFLVDDEKYFLVVDSKDGTKKVEKLDAGDSGKKADLTVIISKENLLKMVAPGSKISPQQAFMKGLLKIKGKMALAMKLTVIIGATR